MALVHPILKGYRAWCHLAVGLNSNIQLLQPKVSLITLSHFRTWYCWLIACKNIGILPPPFDHLSECIPNMYTTCKPLQVACMLYPPTPRHPPPQCYYINSIQWMCNNVGCTSNTLIIIQGYTAIATRCICRKGDHTDKFTQHSLSSTSWYYM